GAKVGEAFAAAAFQSDVANLLRLELSDFRIRGLNCGCFLWCAWQHPPQGTTIVGLVFLGSAVSFSSHSSVLGSRTSQASVLMPSLGDLCWALISSSTDR